MRGGTAGSKGSATGSTAGATGSGTGAAAAAVGLVFFFFVAFFLPMAM